MGLGRGEACFELVEGWQGWLGLWLILNWFGAVLGVGFGWVWGCLGSVQGWIQGGFTVGLGWARVWGLV